MAIWQENYLAVIIDVENQSSCHRIAKIFCVMLNLGLVDFSKRSPFTYLHAQIPCRRISPCIVGSLPSELEIKKKKKRSYANAYTRKGEGLAAAINSMKPVTVDIKIETAEEGIEVPRKKRTKRKQAPKADAAEAVESEGVQALQTKQNGQEEKVIQAWSQLYPGTVQALALPNQAKQIARWQEECRKTYQIIQSFVISRESRSPSMNI